MTNLQFLLSQFKPLYVAAKAAERQKGDGVVKFT